MYIIYLSGSFAPEIKARPAGRRAACGLPEGNICLAARVCIIYLREISSLQPLTCFPPRDDAAAEAVQDIPEILNILLITILEHTFSQAQDPVGVCIPAVVLRLLVLIAERVADKVLVLKGAAPPEVIAQAIAVKLL